ncbi:hypothetical protein [Umezawaea sp. Da 62-37]|uniref:hypothetical protein n=1 Tax=Umezawaea sp. Da 62-37 TaxID=3075927 RepID=UPI0028F71BAE|nr:hypothetical protein [Umezawaea sp. Da 62-37]WNV87595.1 hypothetical protein RM788_04635 [Umezawaea sp. Da 62-37]
MSAGARNAPQGARWEFVVGRGPVHPTVRTSAGRRSRVLVDDEHLHIGFGPFTRRIPASSAHSVDIVDLLTSGRPSPGSGCRAGRQD